MKEGEQRLGEAWSGVAEEVVLTAAGQQRVKNAFFFFFFTPPDVLPASFTPSGNQYRLFSPLTFPINR